MVKNKLKMSGSLSWSWFFPGLSGRDRTGSGGLASNLKVLKVLVLHIPQTFLCFPETRRLAATSPTHNSSSWPWRKSGASLRLPRRG